MRTEVKEVVDNFNITIAKTLDEATAIMDKLDSKKCLYSIIITGKLEKAGTEKYYAVCELKQKLTEQQKSELARLYLETVVLHSAIRERIIPKTIAGTNSKKSVGKF